MQEKKLSRRKFLSLTGALGLSAVLGFSGNGRAEASSSGETLKPGEWVVDLSSSILEGNKTLCLF